MDEASAQAAAQPHPVAAWGGGLGGGDCLGDGFGGEERGGGEGAAGKDCKPHFKPLLLNSCKAKVGSPLDNDVQAQASHLQS